MPRRRSGKPTHSQKAGPRKANKKDGKISSWKTLSDIPLDDEDQFHNSRDSILLEGEAEPNDDDEEEEEVFALQGLGSSSSEDDEEGEEDVEDGDAPQEKVQSANTRKSSLKKQKKPPPSSSSAESESKEEVWGKNKSTYYSSNAAEIESDDEEANEMEEQEAKRLQTKLRETLKEDDFGLGDASRVSINIAIYDVEVPALPPSAALPQNKQSLIQHLEKTCPEALALAREWDEVAHAVMRTEAKLAQMANVDSEGTSGLDGMLHLHLQTQLTYASLLAFYLHLRASEKYAARPELLRSHPIMARLLTLKESLNMLEDLDVGVLDSEDEESDDEADDEDDMTLDAIGLWARDRMKGLEKGELEALLREVTSATSVQNSHRTNKDVNDGPPKKKKRKTSNGTTGPLVFDLVEPEFIKSDIPTRRKHKISDPYGEATTLDYADAMDKGARRKSLRFHTAKIESATTRRQNARNAVAGDNDIPYRQRKKAQVSSEKRDGLGKGGDDLDALEPEPKEMSKKRERGSDIDEDDGDIDGYYDLVQKAKMIRKEEKQTKYEAEKKAARPDFGDDTISGQRSVTRAILANKGLTPHRAKSIRNPRVKKRLRFEKAKKKISSQKAVYKGGIAATGRYEGEKSGISKVVKSVKL